jgi:hypothetical protein
MTFTVGSSCFIVGFGGVKEVVVDRGIDADGYYLVEFVDGQIIPALETQMYSSINDCIDVQVAKLQQEIARFNAQRINQ